MKHPRITTPGRLAFHEQMTPMIDVIFQLLIFFLCTAGFVVPEAVFPTELPPTGAVATTPRSRSRDADPIRIKVEGIKVEGDSATIVFKLNDQVLANETELLDRLGQLGRINSASPVILDIAPTVPIGPVIDLYDETLARGFTSVHFAADRVPPAVESK